jgi:hypothetical protein
MWITRFRSAGPVGGDFFYVCAYQFPEALSMTSRSIKGALAVLVLFATTLNAKAQYAWDIGGHIGGANYLGEFGGKEKPRRDFIWDMKINQTRWAVGAFARRKLNRTFSLNAGVLFMRLQGADAFSENPARVGRNLNFRNDMLEAYARGEVTIFQDNDLGGRGRYRTDFRLFGYVGVAGYFSTPKGQLNREGDFVKLADLNTELVDYSNLGLAIPAGVGFHFTFKRRHRIGWDLGWRTTFSDYIDDASTVYADPNELPSELAVDFANQRPYLDPNGFTPGQSEVVNANGDVVLVPDARNYLAGAKRGDATHNDSYLTMTFTYSYVLKGQSNFYRQRYSWMRGKKRIGRKSRAKF